jgi:hypothetical protein
MCRAIAVSQFLLTAVLASAALAVPAAAASQVLDTKSALVICDALLADIGA